MKGGWVYIETNKPGGFSSRASARTSPRVHQHRTGTGSRFCRRYNLSRLVHVELYPTIEEAIVRQKRVKEWHRE